LPETEPPGHHRRADADQIICRKVGASSARSCHMESKSIAGSYSKPGVFQRLRRWTAGRAGAQRSSQPTLEAMLEVHLPPKVLGQIVLGYRGLRGDPQAVQTRLQTARAMLDGLAKSRKVLKKRSDDLPLWLDDTKQVIQKLQRSFPPAGDKDSELMARRAEEWIARLRLENPHGMFDKTRRVPREVLHTGFTGSSRSTWVLKPAKDSSRNLMETLFEAVDVEACNAFFSALEPFGDLRGPTPR
jgi:hypothetical protein